MEVHGTICNLNFGGIGAGPLTGLPSDADQIAVGDTLTIHFSVPTELLGVATLFSGQHTPFGNMPGGGTYDNTNVTGAMTFKINGITESFGLANAGLLVGLGIVTDFTFTAIAGQPEFYVSGLSFLQGSSIHRPRFRERSRCSPPALARWVCLGGEGSGRTLPQQPD